MKEIHYCKTCGKELNRHNRSGYCFKHLPRTGENNPFYGKTHSKETIEKLKVNCAKASKKMWENEEYRNKVINNATGLKRSDEFKNKQRRNALKQFEDPEQRRIRAEKMKESWQNGAITYQVHDSINVSKQEKEFISLLEENGYKIVNETFYYIDKENGKQKYLYPDGIYEEEMVIIEFNGSFWHADPKRGYKEDDIIHHGITAKEIWDRDKEKYDIYTSRGFKVFTIWSDEYIKNKDNCVKKFKKFVNEIKNNNKFLLD